MRNIKLERKLVGAENWPKMGVIEIGPDSEAEKLPADLSQEEKERIIQSWNRVAVLSVSPVAPFKVGFIFDNQMQFLKKDVETVDGKFGMRISDKAVKIFVIPENLESEIELRIVEIVDENDSRYEELPLY